MCLTLQSKYQASGKMYLLVHDSYAVPNCFLIVAVVYYIGMTSFPINMVKSPWLEMTEALVVPNCIVEVQDIKIPYNTYVYKIDYFCS